MAQRWRNIKSASTDLRDFFAPQFIADNETTAYVRDQMGHSSIDVTLDTYGHLFPARWKEASERFEVAMETARKGREQAFAL